MSITLRVDERLVHGQVAVLWAKSLNLQGFVVANDKAATDEVQKMALTIAVPAGVKCIILKVNEAIKLMRNPKAETMRLMILVRSIKDAVTVCKAIDFIDVVDIGNVGKMSSGSGKRMTKEVVLTDDEIAALKQLITLYPETRVQPFPTSEKKLATDLIKNL